MGKRSYILITAPKAVLIALCFACPLFAEPGKPADHLADEPAAAAGAVNPQNTPGVTREQMLVEGLKNANLDPKALELLERSFRDTPRVGKDDFLNTLTQISGQNRELFKPEQLDNLKRLFNDTLANVNGEPGKELTEAVRKVLKDTKGEPLLANKEKEKETPPAIDPKIQETLNAQLAAAAGINPALLNAAGGDLGMFGLLKELLGDKEDKAAQADLRPQPPTPPQAPTHRNEPRAERGEKKKDDRALLDALAKNRGGGMGMPPQPSSSGSEEKKKEEDKKASPAPDSSSRKKPSEDLEDKKEKTPETPTPTDSVLDGLNNGKGAPPQKGRPLNPISDAGGMGGPMGFPGGMGSGPAGAPGGMGGMGGMGMGGGGLGSGGGGGSSFTSDVFNLGEGGYLGGGGGIAGGSGFNIVRDGGYGGTGGGANSSEESETEVGDTDPLALVARLSAYADQIDMTPNAKATGLSLVEKMVGFAGRKMCGVEENSKSVGFCEGLALRKSRGEFSRRMGNTF